MNNNIINEALRSTAEPELDREISSLEYPEHSFSKEFERKATSLTKAGKAIRPGKRPAMLIAAVIAAALMTVTAGAVVYKTVIHRDSLAVYGVEDVPADTASFIGQGTENEHLRITNDAMLSDGNIAYFIFTLEAKDEMGKSFLNGTLSPEGTGPVIRWSEDQTDLDGSNRWHNMGGVNEDAGTGEKQVILGRLLLSRLESGSGPLYVKIEDMMDIGGEVCKGMKFSFSSLSRNIPIRKMQDSDGRILTVSPIGYFSDDPELAEMIYGKFMSNDKSFLSVEAAFKDGSSQDLSERNGNAVPHPDSKYTSGFFGANIDIEQLESIVVSGVKFR